MINIDKCPCCSSTDLTNFLSCEDFTVSHETFQLKKCNRCELVITTPRPDNANLSNYYQSQNYISHSSKASTIIDKFYLLIRRLTLRWKLQIITSHQLKVKTILDYGCGTGEFLKTCQRNGWQISGVEPSDIARKAAEENTQTKIHPFLPDGNRKFSVITLWHVLEHVPDLSLLITTLTEQLDEDGTLFIAVPNYQSYDAQYYKQYWAGYDVPRHLWHFSESTMHALLNRHHLSITKIIPMKLDSYYVSMLSEKYIHQGNVKLISLVKAIFTGLKSNAAAQTSRQYSSLIYVVKK